MIILNTTFFVASDIIDHLRDWLKSETDKGAKAFAVLMEQPGDHTAFALQSRYDNLSDAERAADLLEARIASRFKDILGDRLVCLSSYLEEIQL